MVEGEEGDSAAVFYHWLPQVSFLSRLKFCKKIKNKMVAAPANDNIYALHIDE